MDKTEGSSSTNRFSSKEVISLGKKLHQRSKKERRVSNQHELLEMLHVKLQAIEEDTNHMKKAVVRCVEERSFLMSEIARQLHFIRDCIVSLQGGDSSAAASSSSVSTLSGEHKAIGLSEVLLQDSKQFLVIRDIRVDLDASQDLAWHS